MNEIVIFPREHYKAYNKQLLLPAILSSNSFRYLLSKEALTLLRENTV